MLSCERCREQLIDHLFGLLDEAEDRAFQTHLIGCAACAAALRQEREFQNRLTRAARAEFPDVRFQPPTANVEPGARPAETKTGGRKQGSTPPSPVRASHADERPTMNRVWTRWAVAASVLVVLAGLGAPAARHFIGWWNQTAEVKSAQAHYDQLERDQKALAARHDKDRSELYEARVAAEVAHNEVVAEWDDAHNKAVAALEEQDFFVRLTGPERPQPGAPNEWKIETLDPRTRVYKPATVDIVVKQSDGTELLREMKKDPPFPPIFKLPVDFWTKEQLKPNAELYLEVVAHKEGRETKIAKQIELAQPVYVTQLATDKPMYQANQPGETVYYRSLTLDRTTFQPPDRDLHLRFDLLRPDGSRVTLSDGTARLVGDDGKPVVGPDGKPLRGVACGAFTLSPGSVGGEYILVVSEVDDATGKVNELEKRKFLVNDYVTDKFMKKLEFDGKSYGAGDLVQARVEASRPQGALAGVPVGVTVIIDGKQVQAMHAPRTDANGVVNVRFRVPTDLKTDQGGITVSFADNDFREPIVRPIPLIGKHLKVDFFPEGGDLLPGVEQRVYFRALIPKGKGPRGEETYKPADLKGYITDGEKVVAEVETLTDAEQAGVSRGQGKFTLKPEPGKHYFLKVRTPLGIDEPVANMGPMSAFGFLGKMPITGFALPVPKPDAVALTIPDGVTGPGEPIRVILQAASRKNLIVGAYARGRLLGHERAQVVPGKPTEVKLNPETGVGGVTRVTVFEELPAANNGARLEPKAERLVYRRPEQTLLVHAQPDKDRYFPGGQVGLTLSARDEKEKKVPAVLMVGVINQSVVTMADFKTDRLMPSHMLLAGEVEKPEELEHADFLLGDHPKAAEALDLLLGTQGWRRFAEQKPNTFDARPVRDVDRLLVAIGQKSQTPIDTLRRAEEQVDREFRPRYDEALNHLVAVRESQEAFDKDQGFAKEQQLLVQEREGARRERDDASKALAAFEADPRNARSWMMPALCVALMLVAVGALFVGVNRKSREESPRGYFATAGVSFAMCALVVVGMVMVNRGTGDATGPEFAQAKLARNTATRMEMTPMQAGPAKFALEEKAAAPQAARGAVGGLPARADDFALPRAPAFEPKAKEARPVAPPPPKPDLAPQPIDGADPKNGQMPVLKLQMDDRALRELEQLNDEARKKLIGGGGREKAEALAKEVKQQFYKFADKGPVTKETERQHRRAEFALDALKRATQKPDEKDAAFGRGAGAALPKMTMPAPTAPNDGTVREGFLRARDRRSMSVAPAFTVREYAYVPTPAGGESRSDFRETVFWNPAIVLPSDGQTTVRFNLADDVAKYQVIVAGHTLDGRIGAAMSHLEARKPFSLDPKLPVEITASDRIDVPVGVVNDSSERRLVSFKLTPTNLAPAGIPFTDQSAETIRSSPLEDRIILEANGKGRKVFSFKSSVAEGQAALKVVGSSDPFAPPDDIERKIRVIRDGFPMSGAFSDLLEKRSIRTVELPKDLVKGSLKVALNVYPSTLADLQQGLEGLLREPNGCFEQTSTTNYPNTLILDYLQSSDQASSAVGQRAEQLLQRGYAKLVSFECQKPQGGRQGYEWFGGAAPPHEALTAYGLLQFKDMARVHQVDPEMLHRTQQYLLAAKDDTTGGFRRNARAIDTFGRAPDHITNAYIVWALTESDPEDKEGMDLSKQFAALLVQADQPGPGKDPYFLSLVANALLNRPNGGNRDKALSLLQKVAGLQSKQTGAVEGAETSITRSGGRDLQIESTALAVLGWLKANDPEKFQMPINAAVKWISQQRGGYGGFGSTQSTILALKALIAHTKANRRPAEDGEITLTVNGQKFTKKFTRDDREVVTLDIPNPEQVFKPGENELVAELSTKQAYPFSVAWACQALTPASAKDCVVRLITKLAKTEAAEGDSVGLNVKLQNTVDKDHGMAVAIVGLPAGTKLPPDMKRLKKYVEDGAISYYETRGRELILYWRALAPKQTIDLNLELICDVPGEYRGPASRGYLYYNADAKDWIDPLAIRITPAAQ